MKKENQCCTLEQSIKLKSLGTRQDSLFYHFPNPNTDKIQKQYGAPSHSLMLGSECLPNQQKNIQESVLSGAFENTFSAYTVAELFAMIGINYVFSGKGSIWLSAIISKSAGDGYKGMPFTNWKIGNTQAESLAALLISTIESGWNEPHSINERLINY